MLGESTKLGYIVGGGGWYPHVPLPPLRTLTSVKLLMVNGFHKGSTFSMEPKVQLCFYHVAYMFRVNLLSDVA